MRPGTFILLSGLLTFGVPLVFGMRELVVLRRPPAPGGGSGGTTPEPEAPRPKLPDCLIPRRDDLPPVEEPAPARARELEPA